MSSVAVKAPVAPVKASAHRESIDSVLAKNLVAARVIAGLTQHDLAAAAGVSRATIAQLETGFSDPRLSTVVEIARALGVAPIVLLTGAAEITALSVLAKGAPDRVAVPSADLVHMREYVESGMLKDRVRAARLGASVARAGGRSSEAVALTAGLFSAALPGAGTVAGAELGRLLE
jgi:transcriptional regulator with XRE-family HTH domain